MQTADNVEALLEQGTEIPYQRAAPSRATSVSFRKAALLFKVKPQITLDGNIIMTIGVNKVAIGQIFAGGVSVDSKHVKTEVLVENGGTVVIGGIYTQDTNNTETQVPFFDDRLNRGVHSFHEKATSWGGTSDQRPGSELPAFPVTCAADNRRWAGSVMYVTAPVRWTGPLSGDAHWRRSRRGLQLAAPVAGTGICARNHSMPAAQDLVFRSAAKTARSGAR